MKRLLNKYAAAAAFVALATGGMLAIAAAARDQALVNYHSQLQSCVRDNNLSRQVNNRVPVQQIQRGVLLSLIENARDARVQSYKQFHHPFDQQAAKRYAVLINELKVYVSYSAIPEVNCNKVVEKP